ncbi:ribosomal protein L1, partial [Chlamydia psittaci 84-8471/1]
MTKHGK